MKNSKINISLKEHIRKNIFLYILTFLFLCIGIVIGMYTVKYMGQVEKDNLISWIVNFSKDMAINSSEKNYIFIKAVKNNIPMIILLWFLGLTMLGTPLILIIDLIKGFTIGFTSSLVINGLGSKGILINFLVLFPQNILYIPCIILSSVLAIEFSLSLLNSTRVLNKKNILLQATTYTTLFVIILAFMFIGFFIEGYITPNILKLIVNSIGSASV